MRATEGAGGARALRDVSEGFAALLWEEVLRPFQRCLLPGLAGTPAGSLYAGLALEVLARQLAREPGLADFLCEALADTTAEGGDEGAGEAAAAGAAERARGRVVEEAGRPAGRKLASPEYNRADRA